MGRYLDLMRAAKCEKSEIIPEGGIDSLISQLPGPPEAPGATPVCAVCHAGNDLWQLDTTAGPVLVHQGCARFLPKPEPAELSAAYESVSAGPEGGCRVQVVEIPAKGLRYRRTFAHLQLRPPAHVSEHRWHQCIADGRAFFRRWGETAQRLGWDSRDLFGLHQPKAEPQPSYRRLSRYDATGLVWLLEGRPVAALTEATATIRNPDTGAITTYRRFNKPPLGPLGDSLDDLEFETSERRAARRS